MRSFYERVDSVSGYSGKSKTILGKLVITVAEEEGMTTI
jgi:hypothetical protein